MQTLSQELIIIIAVTLLLFVITSFVVAFLFIHQRRYNKHLKDKQDMQNAFDQEILKARLEVREKTMHSISQEIHDNLGQLISLTKLNLSTLTLEDSTQSKEKLKDTIDIVAQTMEELRNLSKSLNSDFIMNQDIAQSLKREFELIQKSNTFDIDFKVSGKEITIPPQLQLIVFRIAQESINNIVKHSQAKHITCLLQYLPQSFSLTIKDNGIGFDIEAMEASNNGLKGVGLQNIYHRAKLIQSQLSITSDRSQGTTLHLMVPVTL